MARWYKYFSPDHPVFTPLMDQFGYEGYGKFLAVFARCSELEIFEIDVPFLSKCIGGNVRSLTKLCPMFQETLTKVCAMFDESFTNVSPNFDQTLTKLEPETPVALSKKDEIRLDKTEENRSSSSPLPPPTTEPEDEDEAFLLTQANQTQREENATMGKPSRPKYAGMANPLQGTPPTPKAGRFTNGVKFFTSRIRGVFQTEQDWLWEQLHQWQRVARTQLSLDHFLEMYPNCADQYHRWIENDIALRMAAFAKVRRDCAARKPLSYALKLINMNESDPKILSDTLSIARQMVEANDYEVVINGSV